MTEHLVEWPPNAVNPPNQAIGWLQENTAISGWASVGTVAPIWRLSGECRLRPPAQPRASLNPPARG
jgi:hypothetical protein